MEVSAETYERAINALAIQNDRLLRQVRALTEEIARLRRQRIADFRKRSYSIEAVNDVCLN